MRALPDAMNAQKARGADFESGSIVKRVKALIPILIPLLISSVRRAGELAEAMESKCYNTNNTRTRMKQLKFSRIDLIATVIFVVGISLIFLLNKFLTI